ncbi:DUF1348 family protein [Streptomyces pratensis]|uniref:DUF1348 family protein n=1 Tax=Streptomyces pratensis TaxID=1169025 RepID=UPI0037924AFF
MTGREEITRFLTHRWARKLDYRLAEELRIHDGSRIAVGLACEWHDDGGHRYRSFGNGNFEFDSCWLVRVRHASINEPTIDEAGRWSHRPLGQRPGDHPGPAGPGLRPAVVHRPHHASCQNRPPPELLLPGGDRMVGRRSARG